MTDSGNCHRCGVRPCDCPDEVDADGRSDWVRQTQREREVRADDLRCDLHGLVKHSSMPVHEGTGFILSPDGSLTLSVNFASGTWESDDA